ncbi:unnamed protein product [Schistosoma curassoni]|uniref:Glyco_hydro_3 domain-containing protein n=1 Tax=Schistosoma curassoni TaxID=6186 RepID=A0A183JV02_9TREM|nr:unnamed protein product [Schistosoma curassoni]
MKDSVRSGFEINKPDAVRIGRAQTKLRHYGSSLNNQSNGTRHCTSTSLTVRKHSTVWIG